MSEVKMKRVHISGLSASQCSVQDLHNRFESFQLEVSDVHNWPPGKNGVDEVQNWCFLTLKGEAAKIKRATEVLNGTIWKGSKLRIGSAKKEKGKGKDEEGKLEEGVEVSEKAKKKKKKKKKRSRTIESQKVDQPVTIQDVEDGEWGWKKTPAGHLLRPLHLRPSHPLPLPSARPAAEMERSERKERKRKAKSARALTRAKRVTVDPSRYGAVHLAGPILDDGAEALPLDSVWTCQDTDENGDVEWVLKDKAGNVVKQELVKLVKDVKILEVDSDSASESDAGDDSSMDEVAAAINNAASDISSDDEVQMPAAASPSLTKAAAESNIYDDGEESDFSEGYQEVQPGIDVLPKDWKEEKSSHLDLLKRMFGEDRLASSAPVTAATDLIIEEDSEEEDTLEVPMNDASTRILSAGAQKRAALMGMINSEQTTSSNNLNRVVRFDPGQDTTQEAHDPSPQLDREVITSEKQSKSTSILATIGSLFGSKQSEQPANGATASSVAPRKMPRIARLRDLQPAESRSSLPTIEVQQDRSDKSESESVIANEATQPASGAAPASAPLNTAATVSNLTELFKPQEQPKGFSLLGDLDLDLEFEDEVEDEDDVVEVPAVPAQSAVSSYPSVHRAAPTSGPFPVKLPLMFPTFDANDGSWFGILRKDSDVASFCLKKTDEEIQAQWKERKGQLTQDYKRRHREALKKKKRKYTGSRAAGTSMPLRS